jgi:hypothetical protein
MQCNFDNWLNEVNIDGKSVLVVGDVEQELKYVYTIAFTGKKNRNNNSNKDNGCTFKPRFLFGTSGCIGAGLDSDEVHLVIRLGMPTSLIDLIQEMGQCGWQKDNVKLNNQNLDSFKIYLFCLTDYIYLNEQTFIIGREIDTIHSDHIETCNIISECEERKM